VLIDIRYDEIFGGIESKKLKVSTKDYNIINF